MAENSPENPGKTNKPEAMTTIQSLSLRYDTVRQLFTYVSQRRLWGMVVLLGTLLLVSVVVIFAEAFTYLAPFVYSIF